MKAYSAIVDDVTDLVRRHYLFREQAEEVARELSLHRDRVGAARADEDFAGTMTQLMQAVTRDKHLRLLVRREAPRDLQDDAAFERHWSDDARRTAGGVRKVERLPGNRALIELGPFIGLPKHTARWQRAGLQLVQGADAVIIDLRSCVGGTPDGVMVWCSHFLGEQPVHLVDVHENGMVKQVWTQPLPAEERIDDSCEVLVLVSAETFSGAEQLAWVLQELQRGLVVGERTKGGAHPRIGLAVDDRFELTVPVARPVSPRTGKNWEGVGVSPDIPCSADEALEVALDRLQAR